MTIIKGWNELITYKGDSFSIVTKFKNLLANTAYSAYFQINIPAGTNIVKTANATSNNNGELVVNFNIDVSDTNDLPPDKYNCGIKLCHDGKEDTKWVSVLKVKEKYVEGV